MTTTDPRPPSVNGADTDWFAVARELLHTAQGVHSIDEVVGTAAVRAAHAARRDARAHGDVHTATMIGFLTFLLDVHGSMGSRMTLDITQAARQGAAEHATRTPR